MADKDTRDDLDHGEPAALPDGPRSEGRPAPRAPDASAPPEMTEPAGAAPPPEESRAYSGSEHAGDAAAPGPALDGQIYTPVPDEQAAWQAEERSARNADADHDPLPLEPDEPPSDGPALDGQIYAPDTQAPDDAAAWRSEQRPAPGADPDHPLPDEPPPVPDSAPQPPEPTYEPPWHAVIADVLGEPAPERDPHAEQAAATPQPSSDEPGAEEPPAKELPEEDKPPSEPEHGASFAAVADSLFHPPPPDTHEPHLITLGRRLNPALAVPRPVAPDITPRAEPRYQRPPLKPAAVSTWDRAREEWREAPWKERLRIVARYIAYAAGAYLALVLVLILLFRFVNPPGSMLMLTQLLTGTVPHRTWVPLEAISPALIRAVVVSEDDRFCTHHGIDTAAMIQAIRQSGEGLPRGASTISMQVVKNLFLWSAKSYVRKVIEIPLTLYMELLWPKWRILEVYLNIAEWGPGIFGAEAAARYHFNKAAAGLGSAESALLAATLPNPIDRVAGSPGPQTTRKARVVQSRVKAYGAVASCVVAAAVPSAASAPAAAGRKAPAARKSPLRPPLQRKRKVEDGWSPTLQFGY